MKYRILLLFFALTTSSGETVAAAPWAYVRPVNSTAPETVRAADPPRSETGGWWLGLSALLGVGGVRGWKRRRRNRRRSTPDPDPRSKADTLRSNGNVILIIGVVLLVVFLLLFALNLFAFSIAVLFGGGSEFVGAITLYGLLSLLGLVLTIVGASQLGRARRLEAQYRRVRPAEPEYEYEYID